MPSERAEAATIPKFPEGVGREIFAEGYDAGYAAHAAETAKRPIPVTERLPEVGQWFLGWLADEPSWRLIKRDTEGDYWLTHKITHWLPIPPNPEEWMQEKGGGNGH